MNLDNNTRSAMAAMLNGHLALCADVAMRTKQAHWNVKGANFIALHKLFDETFAELEDHLDTIAERIVALGLAAHGTVRAVAKASTLADYPLAVSAGADHLKLLVRDYTVLADAARAGIDQASDAGDQVTADVLTGVARAMDKSIWFLQAHLD